MKLTKNFKILSLVCAFVLAIACMFFTATPVKADGEVTTSDYFTVTTDSETTSVATLDGNNIVLSMSNGATAKFKRKLDISFFAYRLFLDDKTTAIDFTFAYQSSDPNGYDAENKALGETCTLTKNIEVTVSLDLVNNTATCNGNTKNISYNAVHGIAARFDARVGATLTVSAGGAIFNLDESLTPKMIDGAVAGDVSFKVTSTDTTTVKVDYIQQQGKTEEFILATGETALSYDVTKSVIVASEAFASTQSKIQSEKTAISFTEYSVVPSTYKSADFKVKQVENVVLTDENSKNVWLQDTGVITYQVYVMNGDNEVIVKTATVNVINSANATAPEYQANADAIKNFNKALYNNTREEYQTENGTEELYVRLGSNSYLEIPSMAGFVIDDTTVYDNLTKTVYYRTNDGDWTSTSNMKLPLTTVGKYDFFVLFADKLGNKMEKSDFVDDDGNIVAGMENYVFSFEVYNDAPISITGVSSPERAYKGISYTVENFTILAMNYTTQYSLYYATSATASDSEWEEIKPLSSLEEGTADYSKYADYKYNGSLTFTPAKTGYYKLVAQVFENESTREADARVIIEATTTPKVVKPANTWARDNVWSIVFLSIGTLSLIGIIVVLVIPEKKKEI